MVKVIRDGHGQADETLVKVDLSVQVLEQIIQSVFTIHQMNEQIARAEQEQSRVADEINRNVSNIQQQLVGQFKV